MSWSLAVLGAVSLGATRFIAPASADEVAAAPVVDPLHALVDEALEITARRELDGRNHTPWQIIHGVLGLRDRFPIRVDGRRMTALEWFREHGASYQGEPYFEATEFGGRGHPFTKPMLFEGHPTQFLAYLTACKLPLDCPIRSGDRALTVRDLVNGAQKEVKTGDEPGWTLWALSHYLPPDAAWESKTSEPWSIDRLVRSQTYEPVHTASCGGTHGLFALAYARKQCLAAGQPLRGIWLEADQKIRKHVAEAKSLQNADGSFSLDYFKGRRAGATVEERLGPSGHVFEFLMLALPEEQLREQWARNAVYSVTRDLKESQSRSLSVAPLYHAVSGLQIYRERTAPKPPPAKPTPAAPVAATP